MEINSVNYRVNYIEPTTDLVNVTLSCDSSTAFRAKPERTRKTNLRLGARKVSSVGLDFDRIVDEKKSEVSSGEGGGVLSESNGVKIIQVVNNKATKVFHSAEESMKKLHQVRAKNEVFNLSKSCFRNNSILYDLQKNDSRLTENSEKVVESKVAKDVSLEVKDKEVSAKDFRKNYSSTRIIKKDKEIEKEDFLRELELLKVIPQTDLVAKPLPVSYQDANKKSISSKELFVTTPTDERLTKETLTKFENRSSISSDEYFQRQPMAVGVGARLGNYLDMEQVRESVRLGVTKVAGKLSSIATDVINNIHERCTEFE